VYTDGAVESPTQVARQQDVADSSAALRLSPSNASSSCADARHAPSSKPVAMVQPRKVHGVRVLPSPTTSRLAAVDCLAKPSRLARSPAIRAARPPHDHQRPPSLAGVSSTPRWAGRRLADLGDDGSRDRQRHRYGRCARRPASDNWQCNVPSSGGAWSSAHGQLTAVAEGDLQAGVDGDGDRVAHEALLMTKKKDAEVAALLRHIRLSGLSRDVRPRPPFNECLIERINFERSLGYYP